MAYSTLRAAIQAAIKQNDNEEITGNLLQSVLLSIVNTVGAGYNFAGVATPSTNPGTPDGAMFWIGGKGTYANFGSSVTIAAGYLGIFMWDGSAFTRSVLKLSGGEGVFDVTDYTGNEYADLSAALAAVPQVAKAGGMEIRYVQSSDHKYVQYFLTKNEWSVSAADWQKMNLGEQVMPIIYYNGKIEVANNIVTFITLAYGGLYIWKTQQGGAIFVPIEESQSFNLPSYDYSCAICCNLSTNSLEVVHYTNLSSQYIPLICYNSTINSGEKTSVLGGILPTSLMYDYIVSKEIINLKTNINNIIPKINPIIYYNGHITQNDRNVTFSKGTIYLQLSDGSAPYVVLSQDTTFLIENNDTHICFNLTTRQLELVRYNVIDFYTQIPLISFDSEVGGIMPTSLMYDYILRDEIIKSQEYSPDSNINFDGNAVSVRNYYGGYYYHNQERFIGKTIGKIRLNVATAGTFHIVKLNGPITDEESTATIVDTIIASSTGIQEIYLNNPIKLQEGEYIGINNVTGAFKYSSTWSSKYSFDYRTGNPPATPTIDYGNLQVDFEMLTADLALAEAEFIKKDLEKFKNLDTLTKYSTYNYPFGQCQFNINYAEGKIEWEAGDFVIYTNNGETLENNISAGYSNFIGRTPIRPKTYSRFIYFNRTEQKFDCVEYALKSAYLSEHIEDELYLIAFGSFDNPEQTMNASGTFSIDGVVFGNYIPLTGLNKLRGKNVSILGDSISTYQGYLASDAAGYDGAPYAYWYPRGNVQSVEDTWWKKLINETGMVLLNNCAWSDSEVEGNSQATTTALAGCSDRRIADLAKNGTTPDIVICYIGINDWGHDKQLGTFDENSAIPNEGVISNFADAYMIMVDKIQRTYPLARVFCCTLLNCGYTGYDVGGPGTYPAINDNNVALNSFNNTIINIANCLGAEIIDIRKCGFTFHNFEQYTIGDKLHPNIAGMELLKNFIRNQLYLLY